MSEGTPLHGDRGAWDVMNFDDEHARDIMDGTLRRHIPLPGLAAGYVRSDGADWQRVQGVPLADLADHAAGFIIVGGAAVWGAAPFDWDTLSAGAGADMVHGHGSNAEGGTLNFDVLTGDCDLSDLADYVRGSIIRAGAADWEAYSAKTDGAALVGDGADVVSTLTPTWAGTHSFGAGLTFSGATGVNVLSVPDALANALHIVDDTTGLEFMRIVTTAASQVVDFNVGEADIDFRVRVSGGISDPTDAFFIDGATGRVYVGDVDLAASAAHLGVGDSAVDTTNTFTGFRSAHTKTAGVTDQNDTMVGVQGIIIIDQVGGLVGTTYGGSFIARLTAGTIGTGAHTLAGFYASTDLDAGTLDGHACGIRTRVDQEAANTITGNVYGLHIWADLDGTVTGTSHMIYLDEQTGIDYGIYQSGTAPNYLSGRLAVGGTIVALAQMHIHQGSPTAAIPVLILDQADVSEPSISMVSATGANDIVFPDNLAIAFALEDAGGLEYMRIVTTAAGQSVVVNSGGVDIDFCIEAVGHADAFQVQGSDGQITLGVLGAGAVQSSAAGIISSGPLPLTGLGSYAQGDLVCGGAVGWQGLAHPGAANRVLQSTAAEVSWSANAVTFPTAGAVPIGTGANGQVTYWTAAGTLAGEGDFLYASATNTMTIGNISVLSGGDIDPIDAASQCLGDPTHKWNLCAQEIFVEASISMADNTWQGIGAAAGRIVFADVPIPDEIRFVDCAVVLSSGALTFTAATGVNVVAVPDNLADAWHLSDAGGLEYMRIVSTNAQPIIKFNDGGADVDCIIEAVGQVNAFNLRGSDGHIGMGVAPHNQRYVYLGRTITDPAAPHYAMQVRFTATATANNAQSLYAMAFNMITDNVAHNFGTLYGVQGIVSHTGSGTLADARAMWAGVRVYGAGDVTLAQGLYIHNGLGGGTGNIGTNYSVIIKNPLGAGAGTITGTNIAMYIEDQTRGATNYALYCAGGRSFHGGVLAIGANKITAKLFVRQTSATAAIPVQILDQRDISEPFTNYIGTSAAAATHSLSSWTMGNAVQGHVQIDINGVKRWFRFYDDPTS